MLDIGEEEWAAFADEATAAIRAIEEGLLEAERRTPTLEDIHSIYRGLHTLKGNSGFLSLHTFGHVAHVCEDLISLVRDRGVPLDASIVALLLEALDTLRKGLDALCANQEDMREAAVAPLVARLVEAFRSRGGASSAAAEEAADVPEAPAPPSATQESVSDDRKADGGPRHEARTEFLRIDGGKVSALMDLAGELGLACSGVTRHPGVVGLDLEGFASASHRLELLVRSIQTDLASLRLVPVAPLFQRMRRIVRDASLKTNKDVELRIVGEDTEVDKVMLDGIQDPLVHVLRNAVDHGLESAEERVRLGKRPRGRITLSATQQGGAVTIEVQDDGAGIDRTRVLARAKERGLVPLDADPTDAEIVDFVFLPGFSTKEVADELSGRGVGMDVLRTTVENLRGHVQLTSKPGAGSRVVMTMPLTLAFVDAMVVREHDRLFALPIEKVFEVSKIDGASVVTNSADGRVMLRVRDACVPVVWLHRFWGESRIVPTALHGRIVVLIQTLHGPVALPVDELIGNQQVMLKPLRGVLAGIRAASGCGMLRTGDVAVALDCDKLHAA